MFLLFVSLTHIKNIAIQEELRSTHTSLKQYQNHIKELEDAVAERDTQISIVKESLGNAIDEQKQQVRGT